MELFFGQPRIAGTRLQTRKLWNFSPFGYTATVSDELTERDVPANSFPRDLLASWRVWRDQPVLPLLSTAIWAAPAFVPDEDAYLWLALPVLLFNVGWVGTERIWYLRAFRGRGIGSGEILRFTRAFFGRFARLGVLILAPLIPLIAFAENRELFPWLVSLVWVPLDFALTFVTPALTYSTRRVRVAIGIGFRMIRRAWPASAWYVLAPPLAMLAVARLLPSSTVGLPGRFGLTVGAALLHLSFVGATAAFYVRRHEVGDDGAIFPPRNMTLPADMPPTGADSAPRP
jgi:hypothetical protein